MGFYLSIYFALNFVRASRLGLETSFSWNCELIHIGV